MARNIILTLHRNDLRLTDNALFHCAHEREQDDVTHVLPLFVFDERFIELSGLPGYEREGPEARTRLCKFWRTGAFRARFLTEGVFDMRNSLRQRGSELLIRYGLMEKVTADIVKAMRANGDKVKAVYLQEEFYSEEKAIERKLRKALKEVGVPLVIYDQVPLIHPSDLPFAPAAMPDVFTPFRKRIENLPHLGRAPHPIPPNFKPFPRPPDGADLYPGYGAQIEADHRGLDFVLQCLLRPLQDTFQLRAGSEGRNQRSAFPYAGGETAALQRVEWYFKQGGPPPVSRYKETRNGLLGHAYSTKLSPFLCLGMVSPRTIISALEEYEEKYGSQQNAYWVRFELLWRDYFLFAARKFGSKLFTLGGFEEVTDPKQAHVKMQPGWWKSWNQDEPLKDDVNSEQAAVRWMQGKTGVPFVDANMAELRESGFMSNRGRQNVASFLTKDCQIDWRLGAEFFESHLIDYEFGNWQYVSGVGNDARASRQFNPVKQGNDYDPHGDYIRTWLPQLSSLPNSRIQCPWTLPPTEFARLVPEGTYPCKPVIEQPGWKAHYVRKGPSKQGVPNRNERVRNPGRLIVGKSGRSIEPSGSDSDHSAESGSTDDGLQGAGATAAAKAVQKQFNHVSVQTVREGRQRETRVAGQALGEAKKNGTQGKGVTKENVLY
ncbi:hypothetical protein Rhopal_005119-T1 [Rhodotorula paludigena]|uniref:Cryptochrome DASH n=1 Tax=Rhodotorula paludigena TaxID=86838 RepID=A0AAV5GHI5_9BASI|nr:hypothetical protein Rhopal_005119-T1 [Rhodotorula paludigena]